MVVGVDRAVLCAKLLVAAGVALAACAPSASPVQPEPVGSAQPAGTPKGRVTIALTKGDQLGLRFGETSRTTEWNWILDSPMTYYDLENHLKPMMAAQIPSPENGDWVINADGSMVTNYRLRANVRWHDGLPLTAEDFVFAHRVYLDATVPISDRQPMAMMSSVEARDDQTVVINWSKPYLQANQLGFGLPPLPKHQLDEKYRADSAHFNVGEQWTSDYVGSGPFRLERWEPGVRFITRAYLDWFLGPPRIDTIEVRFLPDPSAVLASLFSGEIDFAAYPTIRTSEAVAAGEWIARGDGYLKSWAKRIKYVEFQYREVPNWQRVVTNLRVRQALMHAIDRDALADVMTSGLGQRAEAWVLPSDPLFPEIGRVVTKYLYDPQRATALLAETGWRVQPSGVVANAAGETLDVEVNSGSSEPSLATIVADNWKQLGVNSAVFIVPPARFGDAEFRASFLAAHMGERTVTLGSSSLVFLTSLIPASPAPPVQNRGAFSDPEVDQLFSVAATSFDAAVRRQAIIALNQRLSKLAAYGPLYYGVDVLLARSRLQGPRGESGDDTGRSSTWNVFEWEAID